MQNLNSDIWLEYRAEKSPELRSKLFYSYLRLVKFVSGRYLVDIGKRESVLERDDLLQAGMIGLLEAIDRFEPDRGFKFETYAMSRIQGAIQDELRKIDWLPRSERKKIREAENRTEHGYGEPAGYPVRASSETPDVMLTREALRYLNNYEDGGSGAVDLQVVDDSPDVIQTMDEDEMRTSLADRIEELPERERMIIILYYYEEMTLKEIGEVLGITESRVSQIHSAVIEKMRRVLKRNNLYS